MRIDDADAIFFGANAVDKLYLGTELIWPSGPPLSSALLHWYDATNIASLSVDTDNTVFQMEDLAGASPLVRTTVSVRPFVGGAINGRHALDCPSGRSLINNTNYNVYNSGTGVGRRNTFFCVFMCNTTTSHNAEASIWSLDATVDDAELRAQSTTNFTGNFFSLNTGSLIHAAVNRVNQPTIHRAFQRLDDDDPAHIADMTSSRFHDGNEITSTFGAITSALMTFRINYNRTGLYSRSQMFGEFLHYGRYLNQAERQSVGNYLGTKWGITYNAEASI